MNESSNVTSITKSTQKLSRDRTMLVSQVSLRLLVMLLLGVTCPAVLGQPRPVPVPPRPILPPTLPPQRPLQVPRINPGINPPTSTTISPSGNNNASIPPRLNVRQPERPVSAASANRSSTRTGSEVSSGAGGPSPEPRHEHGDAPSSDGSPTPTPTPAPSPTVESAPLAEQNYSRSPDVSLSPSPSPSMPADAKTRWWLWGGVALVVIAAIGLAASKRRR